MGHIVAEHWLNAELSRVFAFFSDPRNLPRLMPGEMDVRLEDTRILSPRQGTGDVVVKSGEDSDLIAGPGSLIIISFRLFPFLPFRGKWVAEILEYQPLSYFLDTQRSGPMRSWLHRHSFSKVDRGGIPGTVVRDEVNYELPFGILGSLADALLVERMMRRTFQTRQRQLESFFPPE
jgi:ligand-binding SRPBCC domain-containing protein